MACTNDKLRRYIYILTKDAYEYNMEIMPKMNNNRALK